MKHTLTRRGRRTAIAIALTLASASAAAQQYPHKPIRMLVGFSPGGNADASARIVAGRLGQALSTNVVVENRSGAAGSVAAQITARAPADGYTLFWGNLGALTINRILEKNLPYDAEKAFAPIGLTLSFCNVLVARQDFPGNSVAQLIALAKEKPGFLNYGTQGIGSAGYLSAEVLKHMTGVKLTHVPYKGGNDAMTAVLGGELQLAFIATNTALGLRNRLKLLAVTSLTRDPGVPDVPTMDEAGLKGYEATFWFGMVAPAGTPKVIVDRLNTLTREIITDAEVTKVMIRMGLIPILSSPQEFGARMRTDYVKWKKILEGT